MGQLREGFPSLLQLGNFGIQRRDPPLSQSQRSCPVGGRIQGDQLGDLLQGKSGRLGGADEAEATDIGFAVPANAAAMPHGADAPWCLQQSPSLIVADCLDTHAADPS